MPTALGKTVIAALAAAEVLFKHWDKKILVMAPTRPLIAQHRETFLRLLRVKPEDTRLLTGELEPAVRMREWGLPNVRIYFATPQTVWFDHERGLRFRDFALMVADECHRSRARYAYSRIAKAYVEECPYPLILGLTASPGASEERIRQVCEMLRIEEIIARTEEDEDVRSYVHPVRVEWRETTPSRHSGTGSGSMWREEYREGRGPWRSSLSGWPSPLPSPPSSAWWSWTSRPTVWTSRPSRPWRRF
jgi:Fanconi anemia group M protein